MGRGIRILIVADQPRARKSLKALLMTGLLTEETTEAADGKEALKMMEKREPDVVILDIQKQEKHGLDIAQSIKARWPQIKVLALSLYPRWASDPLAAGADAVISKGEPPARLLQAVSMAVWSA